MARECPLCGCDSLSEFLSEEAVRLEALMRAQFVLDRTEKTPPRSERKDLTDFAHGVTARLLECDGCGLLIRDEHQADPDRVYVEDQYDSSVMERLLPRYVAAYRARETPYRGLLAPGARVLEIGPHFGAFLQVATEWGWAPVGVDIGKDTTEFVKAHGHATYDRPVKECDFPDADFDGVFIWNCFEQIADPHETLAEVRRVLKPSGVLVIRTPNALFYRQCEHFLRTSEPGEMSNWVIRALGYNNLLAFPYLYGYGGAQLNRATERHGFHRESALDSELITLTFPELHDWIVEEQRATAAVLLEWSELRAQAAQGDVTGAWIETVYRK